MEISAEGKKGAVRNSKRKEKNKNPPLHHLPFFSIKEAPPLLSVLHIRLILISNELEENINSLR
jgi:hypothetical protein